jgi:arabinogalactan oligomer/maltooligosaccharide transport system permease protein
VGRGKLTVGLLHLFLITMTLFSVFPVWWIVAMAFDGSGVRPTSLRLWPSEPSLQPLMSVLQRPIDIDGVTFGQLLTNSLILSLGTSVLGILLGATAGYAFARFRFKGQKTGLASFLLLQMFPTVVMVAPTYVLLSVLHVRTSLVGLILAYLSGALPFAIWNLKGYFDTVPKELEESALVDGCTPNTAFWRIILPLSAPAMAVTALFGFMTGWTEIILAWTMLEHPRTFTLSMALYSLVGEYGTTRPWSEFAAMAILLALPVCILMLLLQRFIVSGLTAGAVKG